MNVLISGADSYIGTHIEDWLKNKGHEVSCVDVRNDDWKKSDFTSFDAIIHVAGIVHRKDITDWEIYKKVNVDLPFEIAQKAKSEKVKQFVFFSSMSVYGIDKELPNSGFIDENTPLNPTTLYGKSKAVAEEKLIPLEDENFTVSIVRPPNVYGKNCKGGYITNFTAITRKVPVIPMVFEDAKQSMLYIDNLCELCRLIVESKAGGVFTPQDDISVSAVKLMDSIGKGIGKKVKFSKFFGKCVTPFSGISVVKKVYGGLEYSKESSSCFENKYIVVPFDEAIIFTVKPDEK